MAERFSHEDRRRLIVWHSERQTVRVLQVTAGLAALPLLAFDSWEAAALALGIAYLVGLGASRAPDDLRTKAGAALSGMAAAQRRPPHPIKRKR